ncbi:hypothetical protein IG631_19223 [Alternaria alternata]|nr:hypothetical protein IG631_19223 [Alternaria alternata]
MSVFGRNRWNMQQRPPSCRTKLFHTSLRLEHHSNKVKETPVCTLTRGTSRDLLPQTPCTYTVNPVRRRCAAFERSLHLTTSFHIAGKSLPQIRISAGL